VTRLPYETIGGQVSEADTFSQLIEHLRLAEEAAYTIGHLRKMQDDNLTGQGWLAVGEMLKMTQINVTNFATRSMRVQAGYR
jgi:predicted nucleotide-binding protein (sugar kinase/HSP70/actin superfamily)